MGDILKNIGTTAANALGGGLVGMGINLIGNLIGKKDQEDTMQKQWELEQEKMALQAKYNKEAAQYSQQLAKEMWDYTNYPNQVKALKEAGLNPALIYGQGGNGGGSAQGAGKQEGVEMGTTGAVAMGLQLKNLQAQSRLAEAQAAKAYAEANKINEADIENTKEDTRYKQSLIDTNVSLQALNYATIKLREAEAGKIELEKGFVQKQIEISIENLAKLVRENEIGDETKLEQIEKVRLEVAIARREMLLKEANIRLTDTQATWIQEQIDNYAYQLQTERIKANASMRSAAAAETTAGAAVMSAKADMKNAYTNERNANTNRMNAKTNAMNAETNRYNANTEREKTDAFVNRVQKEIEKWGIELDLEQQRVMQGWIYGGVDAACNVVDAIQPLSSAGTVKDTWTRTTKYNGAWQETRTVTRNRRPHD